MDRMTELYIKSRNAVLAEASAEDGATAVEYGLIIALIAAAIVLTVFALGEEINTAFKKVVDNI